jgi:hypothetical protein
MLGSMGAGLLRLSIAIWITFAIIAMAVVTVPLVVTTLLRSVE